MQHLFLKHPPTCTTPDTTPKARDRKVIRSSQCLETSTRMSGCLSAQIKVLPWAGSLGYLICKGEIKKRSYELASLGLPHDCDQYLPPRRLGSCGLTLTQMGSSEHFSSPVQESIVLPEGAARPCCLSPVFLYSCSSSPELLWPGGSTQAEARGLPVPRVPLWSF